MLSEAQLEAASLTEPAEVEELTPAESHAMFNRLSQDRLGISRLEFLERLDRGEYDNTDSEDVIRLRIMAPFAR
jgi:hypothetical protein